MSLVGLLLAAPAGAQRPHVPLPTPDPVVLEGYCTGFTAVITFTETNQYIIRKTTAPDGTTTLKITGHAQANVTNQTTGESVTYNISGPGTIVIYPDGRFQHRRRGPEPCSGPRRRTWRISRTSRRSAIRQDT